MTREELSQIKYLDREIKLIEEQLKNVDYTIISDSVKGSDVNYPYVYRSIQIEGINISEYENKVSRLRKQLLRRKTELINSICSVNDYISNLDDTEIRQILTLKYLKGLTWEAIARYLNYADESVPRKRIGRYLK